MNKEETIKKMKSSMDYADDLAYPSDISINFYLKSIAYGVKYLVENTKELKW